MTANGYKADFGNLTTTIVTQQKQSLLCFKKYLGPTEVNPGIVIVKLLKR